MTSLLGGSGRHSQIATALLRDPPIHGCSLWKSTGGLGLAVWELRIDKLQFSVNLRWTAGGRRIAAGFWRTIQGHWSPDTRDRRL